MPFSAAALQEKLDTLARQYDVPGAVLAVWTDGALSEVATGVCNIETKVPVTTDTLFQIGSITKLYTAALCLQLVEEGKLELDQPIRAVLPDFCAAGRRRGRPPDASPSAQPYERH
jgi:CubicO group peptidase (beta-lactamase class C family)